MQRRLGLRSHQVLSCHLMLLLSQAAFSVIDCMLERCVLEMFQSFGKHAYDVRSLPRLVAAGGQQRQQQRWRGPGSGSAAVGDNDHTGQRCGTWLQVQRGAEELSGMKSGIK